MSSKRVFASVREKWDHRYAKLHPAARQTPTPFVTACLPRLPTSGRALDVPAGAGRHSVVLASRGLKVDAVDVSPWGLHLARRRAERAGVTANMQCIVADVERGWLPQRRYDVILVSYFLHRPLVPLIISRLQPGGLLLYETFTVAQMRKPYHRGSARERLYLQPGELRALFANLELLFYDESDHQDRETAQLLARKPQEQE